ncbi:DNA-binding transcriptional regulator YiaG [Oxalobacteraceae bacterium GrIS 1.11]
MIVGDIPPPADPVAGLAFSRAERVSAQAVSMQIDAMSRKNHVQILRAFAEVKQAALATALGVSESTVSRWKGQPDMDGSALERTARLLAILGYKLVPIEAKCFIELEN